MTRASTHEARSAAFKVDIRQAIKKAIARAGADTAGMSRDCLWQSTNLHHSVNGPVGTNAAWLARQMFDEVCAESWLKNHVYE